MKHVFSILAALCMLITLNSCDQLVKKITGNSIEGFYRDPKGLQAEFTASKVIISDSSTKEFIPLTFDYRVEGKYVFLETKSNSNGFTSMIMALSQIQFEVIDDNTLKYTASGLGNKQTIFKRVEQ